MVLVILQIEFNVKSGVSNSSAAADADEESKKGNTQWVAQKYIERPLVIRRRKFDIRQWVLCTDMNPICAWSYKECYLRFSADDFRCANVLDDPHLSFNNMFEDLQIYFCLFAPTNAAAQVWLAPPMTVCAGLQRSICHLNPTYKATLRKICHHAVVESNCQRIIDRQVVTDLLLSCVQHGDDGDIPAPVQQFHQ